MGTWGQLRENDGAKITQGVSMAESGFEPGSALPNWPHGLPFLGVLLLNSRHWLGYKDGVD